MKWLNLYVFNCFNRFLCTLTYILIICHCSEHLYVKSVNFVLLLCHLAKKHQLPTHHVLKTHHSCFRLIIIKPHFFVKPELKPSSMRRSRSLADISGSLTDLYATLCSKSMPCVCHFNTYVLQLHLTLIICVYY